MLYRDFLAGLAGHYRRPEEIDLRFETYGVVEEGGQRFDLVAYHSGHSDLDTDVIITAGFHGEEQGGPLTFYHRMRDVFLYAYQKDVTISVYPCINPSGFEDNRRYNRSGENPNNCFLEYEVRPGKWLGELPPGIPFRRIRPYQGMPKETRALFERIKDERPLAFLDIHQDFEFSAGRTYAYIFGDRSDYIPIIQATTEWAELVADTVIENGSWGRIKVMADDNGLAEFSDGTAIDYFWRHGTDYSATVETTTTTPIEDTCEINLTWIRGMIDLAAEKKYGNP